MNYTPRLKCWRCNSNVPVVDAPEWVCKRCGQGGCCTGVAWSRWKGWWHNVPYVPAVLRGDWAWVFVDAKNNMIGLYRYTFRHRLRLLIGITGMFSGGEYVFKRVKFRGRLHRFLNWFLTLKRSRRSRKSRKPWNPRRVIMQPCPSAPKS